MKMFVLSGFGCSAVWYDSGIMIVIVDVDAPRCRRHSPPSTKAPRSWPHVFAVLLSINQEFSAGSVHLHPKKRKTRKLATIG